MTKLTGGAGGFLCCVPGCFNNNKKNSELSSYSFQNGKSVELRGLRKRWRNLISHKDFSPTNGHIVCSTHFPGGHKTYMNKLPTIVPNTPPTKSRRTVRARNIILSNTIQVKPSRSWLFSEFNNVQDRDTLGYIQNEDPPESESLSFSQLKKTNGHTYSFEWKAKTDNELLKVENKCQ